MALPSNISRTAIPKAQQKYDAVVDASGVGGAYTTLSAAKTALGAGKRFLVKAGGGTITDTGTVAFESGDSWEFEPGVVIDMGASGMFGVTPTHSSMVADAAVSGTAVSNLGGQDLSDMESNPSNYRVLVAGVAYAVTSADDTAKTITLASAVPNAPGLNTNTVIWFDDYAEGVVIKGSPSITKDAGTCVRISRLIKSDIGGFAPMSDKNIEYRYCGEMIDGGMSVIRTDPAIIDGAYCVLFGALSGIPGVVNVKVPGYAGNSANNGSGLYINQAIEHIFVNAQITGLKNAGAGSYTGILVSAGDLDSTCQLEGFCLNCDTNASDISNASGSITVA